MCENEHERLTARFEKLCEEIINRDQSAQEAAVREFLDSVPENLLRHAVRLASIYKSRNNINIVTGSIFGDLKMTDKSTHLDTGGGDVIGSAIGANAKVTAQMIQNIKNNIGASGNIDAEGQTLFNSAADEIGKQSWDHEDKKAALGDLEQLSAEVAKKEPKNTLLKRAWSALWAIAGKLPTVISLSKWLQEKHPTIFGN